MGAAELGLRRAEDHPADGSLIEGLLSPDAIHLTAEGYKVWAGVLVPLARKLMNK